jgi:uncharacterized membrane protein YphA (DoxX/SURF4 family)
MMAMEAQMRISDSPLPMDRPARGKAICRAAASLPGLKKLSAAVPVILRIGLGATFLWSGGAKLLDPRHFAVIIDAFGLIPEAAVFPAAFGLAGLEIAAGLGLVFHRAWAVGLVAGLLMLFIAILIYGLWMGLDVDCGCFGPRDPEAQAYHSMRPALYRDCAMLAITGYLFYQRRKGPESRTNPHHRTQLQ